MAVDYLVGQPRFFGSGYLFEEVVSAVAVGPDAGDLAAEIRAVVLDGARLPIRRETRYVARLAARYWSDSLEAELMSIQRGAARWILKRAKEVRKSYIALGLVST